MSKNNLKDISDLFLDPINQDSINKAIETLLSSIGEDPNRQGLQGTPDRIARMYAEIFDGYRTDPDKLINDALFDVSYNEMVIVKDIAYTSMCEHHMLPFFGRAHVAYIPNGKVIGLSKIPRIVDMFAHRLQLQEKLTSQIADFLETALNPLGVAVVVEGLHLCSMMRGVKKASARMVTSAMRRNFLDNRRTRSEFLEHLQRSSKDML
ncbi:MAG TPA: GTP cyclohydrolase I FolE [Chloroflexi bacterium]|nr:GTP cyclohydrolase I FolE [Chloroflexota bacterium]|tara:strand:+ start:1387 stop:2010 length:624 start_codon:yes stop_codon:yes gene_type:complete